MVDLQSELVGTVVAVTPAFCVFEVEGALCVSSWRDVAIGNVVPARETLPPDIAAARRGPIGSADHIATNDRLALAYPPVRGSAVRGAGSPRIP